MKILGIDPGLTGSAALLDLNEDGIISLDSYLKFTTKKVLVREGTWKFKYPKEPKRVIKSGKNKGKRQLIRKTPPKTKQVAELEKIREYLNCLPEEKIVCFIEKPFSALGSPATMYTNYGRLLEMLYNANIPTKAVTPKTWKKSFGLSNDKEDSFRFLEETPIEKVDTSSISHDTVEAILISYYGINQLVQKLTKGK